MRQINLTEYVESGPHPLSVDERDAIVRCDTAGSRNSSHAGGWRKRLSTTLRPGSHVGAVEVDGLSVLIEPKIGIPQLLSLACYAMGAYRLQERRLFAFKERVSLPDALALAIGVRRQKGLLSRPPP